MSRMRLVGYNEGYRKSTLAHALRIFDKMIMDEENGVRQMFRHREWQEEERRINQLRKKNSWSEKGGYIASIFVPLSLGANFANFYRK